MFISNAYAATGGTPEFTQYLFPIAIIVLFYFILIRPQMKQAKEQRKMIEALQKGDEVTTSGGIVGRVSKVGDSFVAIEIAPEVIINVQKPTIQTLLPKGTIKSL
jgi:preprotein translocase subunit YajC